MKYFSIEDEKAEAYNDPFLSPTVATAIRSVEETMENDPLLERHAEDYVLYQVGRWERDLGELFSEKRVVCRVSDLRKARNVEKTAQLTELLEDTG